MLLTKYAHIPATRAILQRRGETVFAPTFEVKTKRGKVCERPLMLYICVRGPDERAMVPLWMHSIRSINNAGKFHTRRDGSPHGIPDSDVEKQKLWLGRMEFEAEAKAAMKRVRVGKKVKVKNGLLAGAEGKVTDIRKLRLKINTAFGMVEVSADDCEVVVDEAA